MWPDADKTKRLLEGARNGDDDAISRLLDRHRDAISRLVGMRLDQQIRQRVDVSDVIQDVLIEANRRLQDYLQNPGMPFHLWLRHIAKDRIIDAHRRHHAAAKRSVDRERSFAGLEYCRQRKRSMESFTTVRASGLKKASQEGAAVPAKVVVYGG